MSAEEDKRCQRAVALAARRAVEAAQRARWDQDIADRVAALAQFDQAALVFSYCAVGSEANPAQIDEAARQCGKQVAYPICLERGRMLAAVPDMPEGLRPGVYGIPAPVPGQCRIVSPEEIDLVLVPCAAFDERCRRLGMGGGYYDRYLPQCSRACSVALAYDVQRVSVVVTQTHDVLLDYVVTEAGIYRGNSGENFRRV